MIFVMFVSPPCKGETLFNAAESSSAMVHLEIAISMDEVRIWL